MSYSIFTDSACDLTPEVLASLNIRFAPLTFRFTHVDEDYNDGSMPAKEFYQMMRDGGVAKTSAISAKVLHDLFEPDIAAGNDIVYLGFSSGLSTTYNNGRLACEDLMQEYPGRKAFAVDSLAASAGQGLFVYLVANKRDEGATIEELVAYAEQLRPHIAHWFTVDDLVYLKRGGRVSAATAVIGGMLNIKPVLHVDDEGHLISMSKVRGRKTSIKALADKYATTCVDKTMPVFISNGDCIEDAEELAKQIVAAGGPYPQIITTIGSVIGAHSGPGTLALFFYADKK